MGVVQRPITIPAAESSRIRPGNRMKQLSLLLVACIVIAYHFHTVDAQFSFSLPGKWGNGKRSFSFSLPGRWGSQGKRAAPSSWGLSDCNRMDPETIMSFYTAIQEEAAKLIDCMKNSDIKADDS